ncbi:MAG TPA: amidohydrolase family protein [Gemmatimonadaceae bacterium]|nr:amidohydrolase family protein [Gemmatimonadaceae bacterium]
MNRYHARWVVPVTAPPIADGTVVEHDGRITFVGRRVDAPPGADHDLGNVVLVPGLVNTHAHLDLSVMRGFLEDLTFPEWIRTLTRARRAVLDPDALLDSARLSLVEAVRAGITTVAETSASGVAMAAFREAGVRGITYQEVFGPDPGQCDDAVRDLRGHVDRLRALETPLARLGISPHAPYSVSDRLFAASARLALDERLPMAIHIAESADEERYVATATGDFADSQRDRGFDMRPRGRSPVAMLHAAGALAPGPLLIHCVRVDAGDIALIAAAGCTVAHCPAANAKLGHGIAPLSELLGAGITVGLGSDSVAGNNRMDLLEEARLAALLQRARSGDPLRISAAEALELATIGGARALGLESEIGSLEPGKAADLAAFSLEAVPATPTTDPITALIFSLSARDAVLTMVAGEPRMIEGRVLAEPAGLRDRVQRAAERLAGWRVAN